MKKLFFNNKSELNKISNVYIYINETKSLVELNKYVELCKVKSVTALLITIKNKISTFEQPVKFVDGKVVSGGEYINGSYVGDKAIVGHIISYDDIVCMCVHIGRWRRGFGFIFLQISGKNGGTSRVSAFMTDTVHHSATCFGTTPDATNAVNLIKEYVNNVTQVQNDLAMLIKNHNCKKDIFTLFTEMVM